MILLYDILSANELYTNLLTKVDMNFVKQLCSEIQINFTLIKINFEFVLIETFDIIFKPELVNNWTNKACNTSE